MFKENRHVYREGTAPEPGSLKEAATGVITGEPEKTAEGFLGGPPPTNFIRKEAQELPKDNIQNAVQETRSGILKLLKLPYTIGKEVLGSTANVIQDIHNSVYNRVHSIVRGLGFAITAIPAVIYEKATKFLPGYKKITDKGFDKLGKLTGKGKTEPSDSD